MSEKIEQLKQKLSTARATLNEALDLIGDQEDEQIYSDGAQWTLKQLAIHLAIADRGQNAMVLHYSEGKEFILPEYDANRYNKSSVEKRASMTLEEVRDSLRKSREELLAWLNTLDDESKLEKSGRHATHDIMTVAEIIEFMAEHELSHAADIKVMFAGA